MKLICMGMLLFFSVFKTISQVKYSQYIQQADSLFEASDFKQAAQLYEKAFISRKPNLIHLYHCACAYAETGDSNSALALLQKAADNGFSDSDRMLADSNLKKILKGNNWTLLINKVQANNTEKKRLYGIDLVKELKNILDTDQLYRLKLDSLYRMESKNQELMSSLSDSVMHYDTINIERVTKIIDKFGWPGIDDVGENGNMTVFLVIQHADSVIQKKYLPHLIRSIKKYQSRPEYYAYLIDRIRTDEGKKQIYGTQLTLNEKNNKYELLPVKNPHTLNKRRKKLGMSTIEQYLKDSN